MPKTFYPLPVKIPLDVPSKVCVISEEGTSCSLIQPIRFANDAYELTYHIIDKTFEIPRELRMNYRVISPVPALNDVSSKVTTSLFFLFNLHNRATGIASEISDRIFRRIFLTCTAGESFRTISLLKYFS